MNYQHITCDLDGAFMIVTLNRPEKLNAYTGQMGAEIADAFDLPVRVGDGWQEGGGRDRQPVHQPADVLAGALVAQQEVALRIGVEVTERRTRPDERHTGDQTCVAERVRRLSG